MTLPCIGITLGDPGGIGPEVVVKGLSEEKSLPEASFILFGSSQIIEEEQRNLGIKLDVSPFKEGCLHSRRSRAWLVDVETLPVSIRAGVPDRDNGRASFLFFQRAVEEALKGWLNAIVTAPVSKRSWSLANVQWHGHTDYLGQLFPQAIMTFWAKKLKVALLSHHLPLKKALRLVKKDHLLDFFRFLQESVGRIMPPGFQFLVSGLNPHAGEGGLLGDEEQKEIIPAIKEAQKQGMNIIGPFPPDTVFRMAMGHPERMVVSLFHDQGLIAFKMEAFEDGVNATLGLPFVRTSPDHGTAFDIAGKGVANPKSMIEAIKLAHQLTRIHE